MKINVTLIEHVTLTRTHVVEIDPNKYPELNKISDHDIVDYVHQNLQTIKDSDNVSLVDNIIKTQGIEEVEELLYECEIDPI